MPAEAQGSQELGMRIGTGMAAALVAVALASGGIARAAPGDWVDGVKPIPAPPGFEGVALPIAQPRPPAGAPPREAWAQDRNQRLVYNVTQPQLIAWPATAPKPGEGARPAVILVPGGGFEFLSMDNEGRHVAERLAPLGVRVFILKYRTLELPDSFAGFHEAIASTFAGRPRAAGPIRTGEDIPFAVADAQSAIRHVRAQAAKLGVDASRVGLVGFSAGAVTTLVTTQEDAPDARPDFIGLIYGPTGASKIPPKAPPLFSAIAADDRFFGREDGLGLIDGWRRAGGSVEFHLFSGGGHGFASQPHGTTSDGWFDSFARWLEVTVLNPPRRRG